MCQGQLLPIDQNTALFSILGTTFGGDGRTTFALPDLRGRVAVGVGTGRGLTPVRAGDMGGSEIVTLVEAQMPSHNHGVQENLEADVKATTVAATDTTPAPNLGLAAGDSKYLAPLTNNKTNLDGPVIKGQISTQSAGGGIPHENRQPWIGINAIICLFGVFPPRN
jgi:microcystin-dependent protein